MTSKQPTYQSDTTPRIRFNWGFWDGFTGAWMGRSVTGHFDAVYAAGVVAGDQERRDYAQPRYSTDAWNTYRTTKYSRSRR